MFYFLNPRLISQRFIKIQPCEKAQVVVFDTDTQNSFYKFSITALLFPYSQIPLKPSVLKLNKH